jgi:hypothetical protein
MTKKMKKLEFNPGFYNRIKFGHNPFVANNERLFAQFVRIFSRTGIQLVLNKQKINPLKYASVDCRWIYQKHFL